VFAAPRTTIAALALACAIALTLSLGTSAFGAHPKRSAHFHGSFAFVGVNGFKAPVSFTVSASGRTLTHFTYGTLGCFGSGGFQPGVDYYTKPSATIRVGTVKVSSAGRFAATGVKSTYTSAGFTTATTTTVSGRFTRANAATGTVRISQTLVGTSRSTCGPVPIKFTARG
jgi:hypothetical protein